MNAFLRHVDSCSTVDPVIHCRAIHRNACFQILGSGYGDPLIIVSECSGVGYGCDADAGLEPRQFEKVPAVERKIFDLETADAATQCEVACINARDLPIYFYGFGRLSDLKPKIHRQLITSPQTQAIHRG